LPNKENSMSGLLLAVLLSGPAAEQATIPVAVLVDRGDFETKATEDLDKLAKKFRERLANKKVKRGHLVQDPSEATMVVQFLSKEWQATGNASTAMTSSTTSRTVAEKAFGVYGVIIVGDFNEPFNLRLSPEQVFNKDNTLSGMVDSHVEDFLKRNYERLLAKK
jgi:hypothetical protein